MKDIKFRIWNGKQYLFADYPSKNLLADSGGHQFLAFYLDRRSNDNGVYFDIQQYTGLKDKNNKEIYEGDICKCRGLGTIKTVVVEDIRQIPVQVSAWPTIYGKGNGECEIIGNIYQNPELLKN